jgi:hypothetical protein
LQQAFAADTSPQIFSAFGHVSYPGSIFIEAPGIEAVHKICRNLPHIHTGGRDIQAVPVDAYLELLQELTSFMPQSWWVQLKKHPYRGNTAFVAEVDPQTLQASLYVIPHIDTSNHSQSSTKRLHHSCPPQALFDL